VRAVTELEPAAGPIGARRVKNGGPGFSFHQPIRKKIDSLPQST
jgi:hypothetical protein